MHILSFNLVERKLSALLDRAPEDWEYGLFWANGIKNIWVCSDCPNTVRTAKHYLCAFAADRSTLETKIYHINDKNLHDELRALPVVGATAQSKPDVRYNRDQFGDYEMFRPIECANGPQFIQSGDKVLVVTCNTDADSLRAPVRVAREQILRSGQNRGGLFFHAGITSSPRGATLVIGDKGAGKTTTIWQLLMAGQSYIANDRCVVIQNEGKLEAFGWPLSMRIGRGMASAGAAHFDKNKLTRLENKSIETNGTFTWGEESKFELTPAEVAEYTGARLVFQSQVIRVLVPNLSLNGRRLSLGRSDWLDQFEVIRRNISEPSDPDFGSGWLARRVHTKEEILRNLETTMKLIENLPIYTLQGDPNYVGSTSDDFSNW